VVAVPLAKGVITLAGKNRSLYNEIEHKKIHMNNYSAMKIEYAFDRKEIGRKSHEFLREISSSIAYLIIDPNPTIFLEKCHILYRIL
jgi:hypothetical protein